MEAEKLSKILELHKKWINNEPGGKQANLRGADLWKADLRRADLRRADLWKADLRIADLRRADLRGAYLGEADLWRADLWRADLRRANLRRADLGEANLGEANLGEANLRGADLRIANLKGANLDYSCWPLWCGSLGVRVCKRIAAQLAYHFCRLVCDDPEVIAAQNALIPLANQFHRVDECGKIEPKEIP